MDSNSSQPRSKVTGRSHLIGAIILAAVFVAALVGASIWITRHYLVEPAKVVSLPPEMEKKVTLPLGQALTTTKPPIAGIFSITNAQPLAVPGNRIPAFHGAVIDAQTQQPVDGFLAFLGYTRPNQPISFYLFLNGQARTFLGGHYDLLPTSGIPRDASWNIRIEAKGYLPAVSAPLHESGEVNFQLTPAKDIQGHIYGPDGQPASDVYLSVARSGSDTAVMVSGGMARTFLGKIFRSDSDGAYEVWPQSGDFLLAAGGPEGFAVLGPEEVARSTDIHLAAWAKLQGRVMFGNKPAAGQTIVIGAMDESPEDLGKPRVFFNYNATTDADGRYSVDAVMPGVIQISRRFQQQVIPVATGSPQFEAPISTEAVIACVESGESKTIDIGGGGRRVVGRIKLPHAGNQARFYVNGKIVRRDFTPDIPMMPEAIRNGTPDAKQLWLRDFVASAAGRDFLHSRTQTRLTAPTYAIEIGDDGAFVAEDVPSGDYDLQVEVDEVGVANRAYKAQLAFTMPAITPDLVDQPLEIADIELMAK